MPDDLKQQIRGDSYVTAEARARVEIDRQLDEAVWAAHDADKVSPATARGVAIREFVEPSGAESLCCPAGIQSMRDVVSVEPPGTQISATTHGC